MSSRLFGILVALAMVTGLAFRLARLDARPMHHDEANQAVKFGALLETGDYHYDASDHHGPTLYFLTLPAAWLRGQRTLAELDETTLRLVPALFGVALLLVIASLARGIGRTAAVIATALAAVSPALTFYSRFYIQEMAFACFSLAFLVAAGRYVERPAARRAAWAGLWAGLTIATKETWMITLPAAVVACAVAWRSGSFALHLAVRDVAAALFVALLVTALFYSSFFTNPSGIGAWIRSFPIYGARGMGDGLHDEPWWYYLHILGFWKSGGVIFSEALILALAAVGMASSAQRVRLKPDSTTVGTSALRGVRLQADVFWPRAVVLYALLTAVIFSAIPYKTPWNLVPFHAALVVVGGCGAARLLALARPQSLKVALVAALAVGTWQLGLQAWRADVRYAADPRNPYVYAQTTTDFLGLPRRILQIATLHPDGRAMLVKVLAGPYEQWPLPWYLRTLTRVGYWPRTADAGPLDAGPIVVASQENSGAAEAALGDRYVAEFYGLRPGVLLTLYIERGIWDRFLAANPGPAARD